MQIACTLMLNSTLLMFIFSEVEVVEAKNGITMAREQKRSIPSMIIFPVQDF